MLYFMYWGAVIASIFIFGFWNTLLIFGALLVGILLFVLIFGGLATLKDKLFTKTE